MSDYYAKSGAIDIGHYVQTGQQRPAPNRPVIQRQQQTVAQQRLADQQRQRQQQQQPQPARRVTVGDVISGDVIKFHLTLSRIFPYGTSLQTTAQARFKSLLATRGFRDVAFVNTGATLTENAVNGEAIVVSNISLSTNDVALIVGNVAREAGMHVLSSHVEIKVRREQASNYNAPSQVPDVQQGPGSGADSGGGAGSGGLISEFGKGFGQGLGLSTPMVLLGAGVILLIVLKR
jgi:hypothetical protein